ncbi:efflux RND transporter periplasmic adaptor subunit [Pseudahrensia aquimaris]|uniref:Efflux RND transporter periplasmic adaptor subunit n=1 Tax=Pseudahrensia aquimaris TaxID=744461 RepID=A0ABW3FG24_9HYPH
MKIRGSHLVALAIAAGFVGWMYTGEVIVGGQADASQPTIVEREATRSEKAFRVRTQRIQPSERQATLVLRGRTEAEAKVSVRAETPGTVEQRPVVNGQEIAVGDLLCVVDKGVRSMQLSQAQAQLSQAQADFEATDKLVKRGFATRSQLRALRTALDAAKSAVATAEQDMSRTEIRAKVAGIVQEPLAEVGDNLAPGDVCVTVIDTDPMTFTGQVSEQDVGSIKVGMEAVVRLITGQKVKGTITRIGIAADPATRTFEVEMALPNADGSLRDGLTAEARIALTPTQAYEVAANWLTLADDGTVGVRAVDSTNKVTFHPVTILSQGEKTMWVSGLEPNLNVIVLGQNFVAQGEVVEAVPAGSVKEQLSQSDASTTEATK